MRFSSLMKNSLDIVINLFIYLLYENLLPPERGWPQQRQERREQGKNKEVKRWKKKKDLGTEAETSHLNPGN